jgi:aldose 1-epimerase
MVAPSGEQIEISSDDQQAVVVEIGGGLRSYAAAGRELLDGYGADEMCKSARGQVLIPWPNRIEDGNYEFDGHSHQLSIDKPDEQTAVHGLVRWAAWTVGERRADSVVMQHLLHPRPGYPFALAPSSRARASR